MDNINIVSITVSDRIFQNGGEYLLAKFLRKQKYNPPLIYIGATFLENSVYNITWPKKLTFLHFYVALDNYTQVSPLINVLWDILKAFGTQNCFFVVRTELGTEKGFASLASAHKMPPVLLSFVTIKRYPPPTNFLNPPVT